MKRNGILVLVYHSYHQNFPQSFESHIKYLKKHCYLLSPDDFCDGVTLKQKIPGRSVLITLDDGFYTDYTIAYPILKTHHAHAVSFVITDPYYTDVSGKDWWREVGEVIEIGSHTVSHAEIFISEKLIGFLTPVKGEIPKIYCMVKGVQSQLGFPLFERGPELVNRQVLPPEALIQTFRETVTSPDFFEQKDWQKTLERMVQQNGIPYHYETDMMRRERIQQEIFRSKTEIEKVTGKPCRLLAYPWGVYDKEVVRIVEEAGYEFAFTANEGFVVRGDFRFTLSRVSIPLEPPEISLEKILQRFFQ